MKTKLLLMGLLGLAAAGVAFAAKANKPTPSIEVTFIAPENFRDAKQDSMDSERGRDAILAQLKEHLVTTAAQYLTPGQRLEIKVTDVDLAGDFEPQRGPDFDNVRIVKDIYPPRATLEFRLLGADGKIVSAGRRQLQNLGYLMTLTPLPTSDPLRHDKELLSDWLRREFKRSS